MSSSSERPEATGEGAGAGTGAGAGASLGARRAREARRSSRVPSVGASVELARVACRRSYRWIWRQDVWLLFTVGIVLLGLFFARVIFDGAREIGASLATGEAVPSWVGLGVSVLWLAVIALLVWTGVSTESNLENDGHYLTIRPVADVVGGHLVEWTCKFSLYVLVPLAAFGLGLTVGTGTVTPVIGTLVAAVAMTVSAVAIGYPIGLALKGIVRRSETLARYRSTIGVVLAIAYFGSAFTGLWIPVVEALEPVIYAPPFAWFGDLALATTPGADVDAVGAILAVIFTGLVAAGGILLSPDAARYAWTADRTRPTADEESGTDPPDHRLDAVLGYVCRARATRGIASTILVRTIRAPHRLIFVAVPLLGAIPLAEGALTTGTLPWYAPWVVVWYGAWAAGVAIPLNPIGNQGATLPRLLTAPATGEHVVHGHVVAAAVPVAPLTAGIAVGAGYLAGRPGPELAGIALASVGAVGVAAVLATGIGSVVPRFEGIDLSGSTRALPPSKLAYGVFSAVFTGALVAVAVVADDTARQVAAIVLSEWLPFGVTVHADTLTVVGWAVIGLVALSVPLAYRVAVQRIGRYRLE